MATYYKKPYLKIATFRCLLSGSLHIDGGFATDTSPWNIKFGVITYGWNRWKCGKPKSNNNGKYKREIEREEENGG